VTCRGSGNGGQHRNKTDSAVMITHIPTKISVRCETERSQHQNREIAINTIRARVWEQLQNKGRQERCNDRNSQIASAMHGDKRRTIQVQHNIVKDHITGTHWRYQDYRNGKWNV
jgi:peptide chain release factor 1